MSLPGRSKGSIRFWALKNRSAIDDATRAEKNRKIKERLLSLKEYAEARTVLFYASFGKEADTFDIIKTALEAGKAVMLPRVERSDMSLEIYEIKDTGRLAQGYMGIPEPIPSPENIAHLRDTGLVVVPGVAYDATGARLGYGKGCYDRLLANARDRPPLVGLAFEEQIVGDVPAEAHDVKVDIIVTDERTIECHGH